MSAIYLDFNGKPTPANDLNWYALRPCGCASGCVAAASQLGPVALTESEARIEMNDGSKRAAKADKRTYVLAPRSEVVERMTRCTHGGQS